MAKGTISDSEDLKDKLADRALEKQDPYVSHLGEKTAFSGNKCTHDGRSNEPV